MFFTAPQSSDSSTNMPDYRLVENAEETYEKAGKTKKQRRASGWKCASGTLGTMIAPYLLGISVTPCLHFVLVSQTLESLQGLQRYSC
jgi:hypothetical protein